MEKYKLDYEQSLYFLSLSNETRETRVTADVLSPSFLASCGFTVWHSRARTHSSLNLKKTTYCSHFQCNLPFIICFQGKIDMLRRVDLKDVLKSGVTTSSFHNRTLPRPATAVPGKNGRNTCYVNVGSLQPNDSWVSSKKKPALLKFPSSQKEVPIVDTVFAYNTNFSTEAHTTNCNSEVNSEVWPVHYACAKPYHAGSGNRGQLFRPHKDSSAWHSPRREVSLAVIDPAVHCLVSLAAVFWMSRNASPSVA